MKYTKVIMGILSICFLYIIGNFIYNQQSSPIRDDVNKVTLNLWVEDSSNAVNTYFSQAIQRFQQENDNIVIDLKMIQGSDKKVLNYMETEIINRISPDIVCLSLGNYNYYATQNRLYSLNDYLGNYGEDYFIKSTVDYSVYNDNSYGIAYYVDPEILVYRKDFLEDINIPIIDKISNLEYFKSYMEDINSYFTNDNLNKVAFSIPTLISDGTFLSSFLSTNDNVPDYNIEKTDIFDNNLKVLSDIYKSFEVIPYDYGKIGIHPFFSGQSAYSVEPLSSIYYYIEKDNNWLRNIGVVSLEDSAIQLSYSRHKYISIMDTSQRKQEGERFLDFFFSPVEVLKRYRSLNMPIVLNSLSNYYLSDINFNNEDILPYIKNSFHYPISSHMDEFLEELDIKYDMNDTDKKSR